MQASIFCAGPKLGNRDGCGRKGIWTTLGDNGIILALICVAAANQLVVTQ